MSITTSVRRFVREFRSPSHTPPSGGSLSRTLRDSSHVGAGSGALGGNVGVTEEQLDIVKDGHKNYDKSFKDQSQ